MSIAYALLFVNIMSIRILSVTPCTPILDHMRKTTSGFTLIELIIVIVVIAILATISTVAYTGIQGRARNVQVISGVNAYQKSIISYALVSGAYPTVSSCLGANYPSNQCWTGPNGNFTVNSGFDTLVAPYIGTTKPTLSTKPLQVTVSDQRLGALYRYTSISDIRIIYYLEGRDQQCPGAVGMNEQQTTQCTLILPPM